MPDYLNTVLLVGCGYMGREYCKVLRALQADFCVVGRGEASARTFYETTSVMPHAGGFACFADQQEVLPDRAIVAVNVDELFGTVEQLLARGIRKILVEKPGAMDYAQVKKLNALSEASRANVFIGYNRRFYASVKRGKDLIAEDGGVSSFRLEFTEWPQRILAAGKSERELSTVFFGNSTHVIDLAFYLGGHPQSICSYTEGFLDWCGKPSRYSGAGKTAEGATFSYHADWESAGRWSVEIMTKKRKLIFCPLEELRCQLRDTLSVEKLEIDDALDQQFKPGLYLQTKAFLDENFHILLPIEEHVKMCEFYKKMERGSSD